MTDDATPAGWYPAEDGRWRWWDGRSWGAYASDDAVPPAGPDADVEFEPAPEPVLPGRRAWPWVAAGGGALIVLVAVVLVVVLSRGAAELSPPQTVLEFDRATRALDCDAVFDVTTPGYREGVGIETCADLVDTLTAWGIPEDYAVTVTDENVVGPNAQVRTSEAGTGAGGAVETSEWEYHLVRDDHWRIDRIDALGEAAQG